MQTAWNGSRLKQARIEAGLSLRQLSALCVVHRAEMLPSRLSEWERSVNDGPREPQLRVLAAALQRKPRDLMGPLPPMPIHEAHRDHQASA